VAERRSIAEGMQTLEEEPIDPAKAKQFVFGAKSKTSEPSEPTRPTAGLKRTPLSTRIRSDYFDAIKRASLERQLQGQGISTLIEILEEALEPWLKSNGLLP
jgi:hypothetical protein